MSCRPGPLRAERLLRDAYTGLGRIITTARTLADLNLTQNGIIAFFLASKKHVISTAARSA